jgi:hypothetical protein
LQESKTVVVHNTAAATLRQVVILLFDKVASEAPEDEGNYYNLQIWKYSCLLTAKLSSPSLSIESPGTSLAVKDVFLLMQVLGATFMT